MKIDLKLPLQKLIVHKCIIDFSYQPFPQTKNHIISR